MAELHETPRAGRLHIALFGRRNSGKSTLMNAITGQETAISSPVAGTTTDPVYKSMEISGLGPCVLIDTPGFDEEENGLGGQRLERTQEVAKKADIAVMVFADAQIEQELQWTKALRGRGIPLIAVVNKSDLAAQADLAARVAEALDSAPLCVSARDRDGIDALLDALRQALPQTQETDLLGGLAKAGDTVLLVMPQDIQAPKGRLILPQVQVTRALLDKGCVIVSTTVQNLDSALASLVRPPDLIITDSQVFAPVSEKKPPQSRLTSFSILMAGEKGDLQVFVEGAKALDALPGDARVLIAEACTHAPLQEDIGRIKLPRLLRKRFGEALQIEVVSGPDFPKTLTGYALVIHCGACMFNRCYVLSRIEQAQREGVPITNYGIALAKLAGILEQVNLPI